MLSEGATWLISHKLTVSLTQELSGAAECAVCVVQWQCSRHHWERNSVATHTARRDCSGKTTTLWDTRLHSDTRGYSRSEGGEAQQISTDTGCPIRSTSWQPLHNNHPFTMTRVLLITDSWLISQLNEIYLAGYLVGSVKLNLNLTALILTSE